VNDQQTLRFEQLFPAMASLASLPPLLSFKARDGADLMYRRYGEPSHSNLILVHGSSAESSYLHTFAEALVAAEVATVYTPDERGHGLSPRRRGDLDYIGQLEDDLADFIGYIRASSPQSAVIVGGHSSGGGLALRFAGGQHGSLASGYLLLSPYLGYDAPTVRPNSGGWAKPSMAKIIPLAVLNGFGVTRFNDTTVLRFNLPEKYRTGKETLAYSYRMMTGFNPRSYKTDLAAIRAPLLILEGSEDEAFDASQFEPTVRPLVPSAAIKIIEGASHLGIVTSTSASAEAISWLRQLKK
jgi:alpha-beta hydrolase superfamily lysophospholipase